MMEEVHGNCMAFNYTANRPEPPSRIGYVAGKVRKATGTRQDSSESSPPGDRIADGGQDAARTPYSPLLLIGSRRVALTLQVLCRLELTGMGSVSSRFPLSYCLTPVLHQVLQPLVQHDHGQRVEFTILQ